MGFHLVASVGPKVSETAFCGRDQCESWRKMPLTYLKLSKSTVNPLGIIGHTVDVCKGFDPHFYFTSVIEDSTVTIHMVNNWRKGIVRSGIAENGVIPLLEVWVASNQGRERLPLVGRCDETWTVRADVGSTGTRGLEGIFWPRQSSIVRGVECGGSECCGISLSNRMLVVSRRY